MVRTPGRSNISHLGKRKIIFKMPFLGDMLVPWRVTTTILVTRFTNSFPVLKGSNNIIIYTPKLSSKKAFSMHHMLQQLSKKFRVPALEHRHQQRHAWGTPTCLAIQDLNDSGGSGHRFCQMLGHRVVRNSVSI